MPHHQPTDAGFRAGRLVLLAGLLLGCSLVGQAQEFENVPKHYFNDKTFEIPFEMRFNRPVKQVLLHASTDGKVFRHAGTASPRKKHFVYDAPSEGWHYFVVQIEDYNGNKTPARVDSTVIDLSVCVDLEKPKISTFRPVVPEQGQKVAVEWRISDDRRVNAEKLKLDYRAVGGSSWTALQIRPKNPAQFSWSPPAGEYEVRLTAFDLAGNSAQATTRVTSRGGDNGPSNPEQPSDSGDSPTVFHVPKKTFKLDYKIENVGRSQVKSVEVWYTRDTKQWSQFDKKNAPTDPTQGLELTVRSAGRWGFTLRPISGVGRAPRPPNTHEQPQVWVEVDEKPPEVKIRAVTVGEESESGTITVRWSATDQWLRKNPITISYKEKGADWVPLKSDLPNTGSATLPTKEIKPFEFFVKVEAKDEAGNIGKDETQSPVTVDLEIPQAKILKVEKKD